MNSNNEWKFRLLENLINSLFLEKDISKHFQFIHRESGSCWAMLEYQCASFTLKFHDDRGIPQLTLEKIDCGIRSITIAQIDKIIFNHSQPQQSWNIEDEVEYLINNYVAICKYFEEIQLTPKGTA